MNDHRAFFLLEVILPRMKLVYISRGGFLVVFLHQFHKHAFVSGKKSHCYGNLSVKRQDGKLCTFLFCSPVVVLGLVYSCLVTEDFRRSVLWSPGRDPLFSPPYVLDFFPLTKH